MKRFLIALLLLLLGWFAPRGHTETNLIAVGSATNRPPVEILSKSLRGAMSNKTLVAIYSGAVSVTDARLRLTTEELTIKVPTGGGRPESMVAVTNVLIVAIDERGRTNTASGDKAVYSYKVVGGTTNETVVLTGNPATVVTPEGTMTSDRIDGDLLKGTFDGGTNVRMTINPGAVGSGTNSPGLNFLKRP